MQEKYNMTQNKLLLSKKVSNNAEAADINEVA